jgi:hypothetical protein
MSKLGFPEKANAATVYFKNGMTLDCDYVWKDGNTVFLVVHGKRFAVGYEQSKIDTERSFRRGEIRPKPTRQKRQRNPENSTSREVNQKSKSNPYVKYKYGSNWTGPGVHRRIEDKRDPDEQRSKGSDRYVKPRSKKTIPRRGDSIGVTTSIPNSNRDRKIKGSENQRVKGYERNTKDIKRPNNEVRRYNENLKKDYDRKQKEYRSKVKEYEKKRREVEAYNAQVEEHNAQLRKDSQVSPFPTHRPQQSRGGYSNRKPYLGKDDPNRPYLERHPASRRWD